MVYCWKYACSTASAGVGLIGSGAIIDQLIEEGGHSKIFLPYLASYLNKVMVNNNPQDARFLYNNVKKTLNNYNVASEDVKYLKSTLGQLSNEDLTQYNLNSEDARLFKKEFLN